VALRFALSTTRTNFRIGENVPFAFTVTNTGSTLIKAGVVNLPGRTKGDLIWGTSRRGGSLVWTKDGNFSENQPAGITWVSFARGQTRLFPFIWSQKSNAVPGATDGAQVPPGTYTISTHAWAAWSIQGVKDLRTEFAAAPMDITIR
jgi:hypothetical protein